MARSERSRPASLEHDDKEEDDYLTMTFEDPTTNKKESLVEQKKRKQREAEIRGRPKSKQELAKEEAAKREAALSTNTLDTSNKGYKMMAALGYKAGSTLGTGKATDALLEPVGLEVKEGRSGIGADSEKKRKFREEVERKVGEEKKVKVEEGDFRERNRLEREHKRKEAQVIAAQKVCERLEDEELSASNGVEDGDRDTSSKSRQRNTQPLEKVNVLWRGLVKHRAVKDRDRRMRHDLQQSLTRTPTYDDPEEDKEDRFALGRKDKLEEVEVDLDAEDEELDGFEALEPVEKLSRLVTYLRESWFYCFWCKYRYPDKELEGCPGITEEDHD